MKDSRTVTNGYKGHTCSILSTGVLESKQETHTDITYVCVHTQKEEKSIQNHERQVNELGCGMECDCK